ncbi:MAG: carbohydrate binding domain-containing protein, partial [Candidatus Micrarchaeota archaeon]
MSEKPLFGMFLRVFLLLVSLYALVHADAGPVSSGESADDVIIDSFEAGPAAYTTRTRGEASAALTGRSGIARHGNRSILVQMAPSGEEGRHSVILTWPFNEPADWSAYGGLSLWVQTHGDPPPRITPSIVETGGARYWVKTMPIQPRKEGEWQRIELPFKEWTWSWEGPEDENGKLDLNQVKVLQMEIRASKDAPLTVG